MELNRENLPYLVIAALLGTGGGTGVSQLLNAHTHPEIIQEIREVQYDGEIYKLTTQLETMEDNGQKGTPAYKVAEAQLLKFTQMRTALGHD